MVLALWLQREQPDPKAGSLMFNENLQQILLSLQRLVGSLRLRGNICNASEHRQGIDEDLILSLDL
jgi:hypothetical protein